MEIEGKPPIDVGHIVRVLPIDRARQADHGRVGRVRMIYPANRCTGRRAFITFDEGGARPILTDHLERTND